MLDSLTRIEILQRRLDKWLPTKTKAKKTRGISRFEKYGNDPVAFAVEVLGIKPWSRQEEILRAVSVHEKVATRSGHKIGKTTTIAILALWWFCTRARAFVILTSSTDTQIKRQLWPEVQRLYRGATVAIGGKLNDTHHGGLVDVDRTVFGVSTNNTENMGGYSGAELLFLADEASGIDEGIFNAIEGNRAGGARLAMFGNPTQMSGTFYDAFHDKQEFWHPVHVSSTETPNASGSGEEIPGLATKAWVEEKTAELGGPGNPEYDIRVAGEFPAQGEDSVIGSKIIVEAQKRWRAPTLDDGPLEVGVDVARFGGDESVVQARRGKFLYEPKVFKNLDGPALATKVLELVRELREEATAMLGIMSNTGEPVERRSFEKAVVKIDSIGVGASPYDILKQSKEIEIIAVDVGTAADNDEDYVNLRAQLWFGLRDWLKVGAFKTDSRTANELAAVRYKTDAQMRYQIESKDNLRKRIHRSPDRADAMALAVYRAPVKKVRVGSPRLLAYADY